MWIENAENRLEKRLRKVIEEIFRFPYQRLPLE